MYIQDYSCVKFEDDLSYELRLTISKNLITFFHFLR